MTVEIIKVEEWNEGHKAGIRSIKKCVLQHDGLGLIAPPSRDYAENHAFVAVNGRGKPVGFAGIYRLTPETNLTMHVAVHPKYRQQGTAERLCRMAITHARLSGATEIHATTDARLTAACKLLDRLGFNQSGSYGSYINYIYRVQG